MILAGDCSTSLLSIYASRVCTIYCCSANAQHTVVTLPDFSSFSKLARSLLCRALTAPLAPVFQGTVLLCCGLLASPRSVSGICLRHRASRHSARPLCCCDQATKTPLQLSIACNRITIANWAAFAHVFWRLWPFGFVNLFRSAVFHGSSWGHGLGSLFRAFQIRSGPPTIEPLCLSPVCRSYSSSEFR